MSQSYLAASALGLLLFIACFITGQPVMSLGLATGLFGAFVILSELVALPVPGGGALSFAFVWLFCLAQLTSVQGVAILVVLALLLRVVLIEKGESSDRFGSLLTEAVPALLCLFVLSLGELQSEANSTGFPRGLIATFGSLLLFLVSGPYMVGLLQESRDAPQEQAALEARQLQFRLNTMLAPAAALLVSQNIWWGFWMIPVMLGVHQFSWARLKEINRLRRDKSEKERALTSTARRLERKSVQLAVTEDSKDLVERCLVAFSEARSFSEAARAILTLGLEISSARTVALYLTDRDALLVRSADGVEQEQLLADFPFSGLLSRANRNGTLCRDKEARNWAFPLYKEGALFFGDLSRPMEEDEKRAGALLARQASFGLRSGHLFDELKVSLVKEQQAREQAVRAQQELQASQEQLIHSSKMAAVGQLAAGVAHELNSPLAACLLSVQAGRRSLTKGRVERGIDRFDQCEEALRKAKGIVDGLLSQSRLSGEGKVACELAEAVSATLKFLQERVGRFQCEMKLEIAARVSAYLDPAELTQILTNLVLNSAQAMQSEGGVITVKLTEKDEHAILEVKDQGPGIPPEYQERLFQPFFTTKPEGEGTGLGLFISKELAERNDGELKLLSSSPKGCRFALILPTRQVVSE